MATDSSLPTKANKKPWKGLMGGAGGDVRGGAPGALAAGNDQATNRRTDTALPHTTAVYETAKDSDAVNQKYDNDGAGNITVSEVADDFADQMAGVVIKGFDNTAMALGDSFHNTQYESGTVKGIDDIDAGDNGAIGTTAVGLVAIPATTVGDGGLTQDWNKDDPSPDDWDPTGGRVRVVVYAAQAAPQTPGGDDRDAPRGVLASDGTYYTAAGGEVWNAVTAIATEQEVISGLTNDEVYIVGCRVEMPAGHASTAGGQPYRVGPWVWQAATPTAGP